MRGLKSTLALLAVLIGLGAYIYFVAPADETTSTSTLEKVFPQLEAADIRELRVRGEDKVTTYVKMEGDAWQIVEPVPAPASATEIGTLTSALAQIETVRVIDEKPAELSPFGLAPPRFEVEFTSVEGKPSGKLMVGTKTPTGGDLYARRNDEPRVFLIPAFQEASLNRATFDLRDKTVLRVQREAIDGLEIAVGGKPMLFTKEGGDWKITAPLTARADAGTVESLVGRVETAQMKSVVVATASPEELKKFGFDRPTAALSLKAGSSTATLVVGGKAGDDTVYARDSSRPEVVTIESALADELTRGLDEYRRKDAFDFRAFNATRAEIARSGQTLVLERVKGEGDSPDTWKRVSPNPGDADRTKVETLLTGLADVRAMSFTAGTAGTGLDQPAMTVSVAFDEGKKQERVSFGQSGSNVYVSIPGEAGAAAIDPAKFNDAVKAFDELLK